jgi:hypothetical protein
VSNFIVADLTSLDPVESSLLYNVEEHFEDKNLKTSLLMAPSILTNKLLDKKNQKNLPFFFEIQLRNVKNSLSDLY